MSAILEQVFSYVVVTLAVIGIFINILAFIILQKKHSPNPFHIMLKFLSVYDILLCAGGGLTYGLPHLWTKYQYEVFPYIAPFLAAFVHIFLMTSVFTTILISFERYIRICYLCQMRQVDFFSNPKKLKYFLVGIVIIPVLFYIPKFFEYKMEKMKVYYEQKINCSQVFAVDTDIEWTLNTLQAHSKNLQDCIEKVTFQN